MKITKLPNEQEPKYISKQKALEGCYKCPYCGEDSSWEYNIMVKGYDEGVEQDEIFANKKVFINLFKIYKKTTFACHTCGAEWESEPYEV